MNEHEATEMAAHLLASHGDRGFDISMPDLTGYEQMRAAFARLGRESGPDGDFFIVRIAPIHGAEAA